MGRYVVNFMTPEFIASKAVVNEAGCWLWPLAPQTAGYGQVEIDGKNWLAHRASWTASFGAIPAGLFVCHRCDVPPCVNPAHLFLGTAEDNWADAVAKGRKARGFPPGAAKLPRVRKLTDDQVREIRAIAGESGRDIAKRFGVGPSTINDIRSRRRKAHVPD